MREIEAQYQEGLITNGERYNKVIDIWAEVTEKVSAQMMENIGTQITKRRRRRRGARAVVQLDLHDGRLGRARFARSRCASSPACAA